MATSQAAVATGGRATQEGYPRRWLAAIVMIVGALMDMIDVTIVNVALPSIRRDLHASATQLEWVVSGYMLAFAAALIIAGNLGDKFGRKRLFLSGAALFGLASLAAGLSGSGAELIAARVVQGAAAAAMAPQVLATFRVIFAREERGKAFGIYGAMLGFASAIGLVLGGLLTEANVFGWEWRSVFFVNVPVAVAALIAGARYVPETRDPAARRRGFGSRLLDHLEAYAREHGVATLRLDTRDDLVEARRLYARHGYAEVRPFSQGPYADHWFEKHLPLGT